MYIVDARVRPPIQMFRESILYRLEALQPFRQAAGYGEIAPPADTVAAVLDEMKRLGIAHGIVPGRAANPLYGGGHQESLVELVQGSEGYLSGLAAADATAIPDAGAFIDDVKSWGFKGITIESGLGEGQHPVDSDINFPLYEAAQSAGLVAYIMGGGSAGRNISFSDPRYIDRVADNFPQLKIVAVHGGYPYVQEICGVVFRRSNVWVLPDLYFPGLPGEADYLALVRSYGQDRVLFGTAYPVAPHAQHLAKYLQLPVSASIKEKILGLNAANLFELDLRAATSGKSNQSATRLAAA